MEQVIAYKERQMGFHPGDENLLEIFGPEAESFTGSAPSANSICCAN